MSDSDPESYNSDQETASDYYSDGEPNFDAEGGGYPTFGGDSDSEEGDDIVKPKLNIGAEITDSVLDDEFDFGGVDYDSEEEEEAVFSSMYWARIDVAAMNAAIHVAGGF